MDGGRRKQRKHRRARHQPARTKSKKQAGRAVKITGWAEAHGQDESQNDDKNPDPNEELPPPLAIRRGVFRIFGVIFSKWWALQLVDQFYLLALVIIILGFAFSLIQDELIIEDKPTNFFRVTILLAYSVAGIGFGVWLWPRLQRIWGWPHGKLALTLLHGGLLLPAIILARILVAEALGLPPQDFDVTVTVCTLLFYLPLWLIVFAILVLLFAFIHYLSASSALIDVSSDYIVFPIYERIHRILKLPPRGFRPRFFLEQKRGIFFIFRGFMHLVGALGISLGIALFWLWYPTATRSITPMVRVLAYFADFQQVFRYPGIDVNRRLRLHENGVVSYAEKCGSDICISVEKLQEESFMPSALTHPSKKDEKVGTLTW
jgi:hypothetical protein